MLGDGLFEDVMRRTLPEQGSQTAIAGPGRPVAARMKDARDVAQISF